MRGLSRFVLIAEASGAQVEPFGLAVYNDSDRVNVGYPAAIGAVFRVAYVMTELR